MAAPPPDRQVLKTDLVRRMDGAIDTLKKEFSGLRTGRASPSLLEPIRVEAYGNNQPLSQVGNVSVAGPSMLQVQVWDRSVVKAVEIAIRDSGLGLNPQSEGQTIRVMLPPLTEQRRNELAKTASKYSEGAKVAIRGVRRDGMEQIQAWKKKSEIGEDDAKRWSDEVQKLTDEYVKKIDVLLAEKEKDIKTV
ncbi:ribosome recycling factor [Roseococcus sp. SDR]|jgi:ribosome recycling factor|uniref:ribosome recycling factor n=1 Tax=Roseomonadaceae TaxID=3385906 RepID=UPI001BCC4ADE|nr:ribosome recycling factor [Roseococcus sp. SDR]MBS7790503.1 ribosome recycling factor [Roseococcus sp. SDR]MBV1845817.1 ribosome recycling factor [Roseococcus sp. SDR]